MGCGNSRNICEDLKMMLDRMRGMIDNKERMLKEKDDKEVRKINDELLLLSKEIKEELSVINKKIEKQEDIENFQYMNATFQFYLNKDQTLNSMKYN